METSSTNVLVQRYTGTAEPFYQTYELRYANDMTILDALSYLKDSVDGSLTFRWSCRMGICGSCAAVVNGKPVLLCQTYMKDVKQPVKIEPLRNFPIVRDLVIDIDDAFEKIASTQPYIDRMEKTKEIRQTPAERKKLEKTSQCIKCMICYSACPVYGLDKKFVGPAASAIAQRYITDSRNLHPEKQIDAISGDEGVWKCSFVGACSSSCPKRVDPATAVQRLKISGALRLHKK